MKKYIVIIVPTILLMGCISVQTLPGLATLNQNRPTKNWHFIAGTGNTNIVRHYIDRNSIRIEKNGIRFARIMSVYEKPKMYDNNGKTYQASVFVKAFNCSDWNEQQTLKGLALKAPEVSAENVIGELYVSKKWFGVRENSVGDMQWHFVCGQ